MAALISECLKVANNCHLISGLTRIRKQEYDCLKYLPSEIKKSVKIQIIYQKTKRPCEVWL